MAKYWNINNNNTLKMYKMFIQGWFQEQLLSFYLQSLPMYKVIDIAVVAIWRGSKYHWSNDLQFHWSIPTLSLIYLYSIILLTIQSLIYVSNIIANHQLPLVINIILLPLISLIDVTYITDLPTLSMHSTILE